MREWLRTILLCMIIALGVIYIIWSHHAADTTLLQGITR